MSFQDFLQMLFVATVAALGAVGIMESYLFYLRHKTGKRNSWSSES